MKYDATDKFLIKFTKMNFTEFRDEFDCDGMCDAKKLRNDYDNRFKPKNLILYSMHYKQKELENKQNELENITLTQIHTIMEQVMRKM